MDHQQDNLDYRSYMSLLSLNHQNIYNYILMLVANHNDADDIMQETSIVMYEKFPNFEIGTDFLAWARTIAKFQTLKFLKKRKSDKTVISSNFVEIIDQQWQQQQSEKQQQDWIDALRRCLKLLPIHDSRILQLRYYDNVNVRAMAHRIGCSSQKVYRNIARINGILARCVRGKIQAGDL